MAETVTMPKLGFDMAEGTLVRWVKVEGDQVNKGEILAEIETDKATVEVDSGFSGVVLQHLVNQGDIVPIGTPIAVIGEPGEKVAPPAGEPAPAKEQSTKDQAADTQSGKGTSGKPAAETGPEPAKQAEGGRLKISPLARRMAEENGIDLSKVTGSGPGGRIIRSDIETALASPQPAPSVQAEPVVPVPAAPAKAKDLPVAPPPVWAGSISVPQDEVVKVNRLRGAIGRRMVESKTQIPHFYVTRTYNFEKLMQLRSQLNAYLPDDQKITVNDFIIKAVALTLRQFPNVNSSLRGDEIIRHGHINVGSAVSIEGGLMTVVVKDADQKPLRLISAEMREMSTRARSSKVRPEDIEGSTFSISNMGMYDVDHFIAIINPPEAGILAVGSAMQVPVVDDGVVKVGTRMKATISIDHRVSDGAEAARFMQALAAYLEEPMRLVL